MSETPGIDLTRKVRTVHTPEGMEVGHIRYEWVSVENVPPQSRIISSMSWPYTIGISTGKLFRVVDHYNQEQEAYDVGDYLEVYSDVVHPLFYLSAPATAGDTTLTVAGSMISALGVGPGDYVMLGDSIEHGEPCHVISADPNNNTIHLESGVLQDYPINDPLHLHRYFVGRPGHPYLLLPGEQYNWGEETLDSTPLPAGVPLRFAVHNNSPDGGRYKTLYGQLSILYGD